MQTATARNELHRSLEQQSLIEAFDAFSSSAQTLQNSYLALGQEVSRLRQELARERDLRRRREALAEISALLAHEIRNPLASMELFASLLADSRLGEQEAGWLQQIRSGLRILSATVNNILEYHSDHPLQLQPLEVNGVLRSLEALLAPVAQRAGVRWISQLSDAPLWVPADRHRLEQVFLNLALNAFRFAAQGGVLRVATARHEDRVWVSFEDEGPGIMPELLSHLFDPGVTTRAGGPGLGLAVVRRVVQQHGGSIEGANVPGKGTRFEMCFRGDARRAKP
jgi:signal transduction histidine kinase